jgi:hypothetical protein
VVEEIRGGKAMVNILLGGTSVGLQVRKIVFLRAINPADKSDGFGLAALTLGMSAIILESMCSFSAFSF